MVGKPQNPGLGELGSIWGPARDAAGRWPTLRADALSCEPEPRSPPTMQVLTNKKSGCV